MHLYSWLGLVSPLDCKSHKDGKVALLATTVILKSAKCFAYSVWFMQGIFEKEKE